jgi:hypothetical protein
MIIFIFDNTKINIKKDYYLNIIILLQILLYQNLTRTINQEYNLMQYN